MPKAKRKAVARTNKPLDMEARTVTRSHTKADTKPKAQVEAANKSPQSPLFFWKETEIERGFLSPWYKSTFEVDGKEFQSAGQSILAAKARAFGDEAAHNRIITETGSDNGTDLNMSVENFDQYQWDKQAVVFADAANMAKFTNGPESEALFKRLANLGDREFVYADPSDRVFGIGYSASEAELAGREKWGLNLFGKSLGAVVDHAEKKKVAKLAKDKKTAARKKTMKRKKSKTSQPEEPFDASVFDIGGRMSINW